jgi:potassium-transporting ATPase ATP-binding subunit
MKTKIAKEKNIKDTAVDCILQSFRKLSPTVQIRNPVMFVVYAGAVLTTVFGIQELTVKNGSSSYTFIIAVILWFTVLFANFAEAVAEGRGRAQADSLRKARKNVMAKKFESASHPDKYEEVLSSALKKGDIVYVKAGDSIPMDGEVIEGAASVDESAITGNPHR